MKNLIKILICGTLILGTLMFASCASQDSDKDEGAGGTAAAEEQLTAEADKGDKTEKKAEKAGDDSLDSLDKIDSTAKPAENSEAKKDEAKAEIKEDELGNLDALGLDDKKPDEKKDAAPKDLAKNDTLTPPPADTTPPPPPADNANKDALAQSLETPPASPDAALPPPTTASPSFDTTPPSDLSAPPVEHKKKHGHKHNEVAESSAGKSLVPKIPAGAIRKNNALLNRFYFVRQGDTPESASQLFYGNPGHKDELQSLNEGAWHPGTLIYYNSPIQPGDQEMRSFYQERNVPPEEYQVKKGETLQKIAAKKFGSKNSWKELAVINGLEAPAVSPGQKIAVYPVDLSKFAYVDPASQVAANQPKPEPQQPQANVPPPEPPKPAEPPPAMEPKKPTAPGMDISQMLQQNMSFIMLIGGLVFLLLLLMIVAQKKRKAKKMEELSGDEGETLKSRRR